MENSKDCDGGRATWRVLAILPHLGESVRAAGRGSALCWSRDHHALASWLPGLHGGLHVARKEPFGALRVVVFIDH